jgi:hypothetical protein
VNATNPNLPLLESVVAALGPLCPRFVFVRRLYHRIACDRRSQPICAGYS